MLAYFLKNFRDFYFFFSNREFGEYFCKMSPKKRSKRRGSQERMSTLVQARNPELDKLTCVPETQHSQQAAGVEEVVVGMEDPLEMLDTEQGDIVLEAQQDSDSSDEDIVDKQAAVSGPRISGHVSRGHLQATKCVPNILVASLSSVELSVTRP